MTTHPAPSRPHLPNTGGDITAEELHLAARNHGILLEALRYDVTPVGLHYLLTHYDIPAIDPAEWRLHVDGAVESPASYDLASLQERPRVTQPVTLECAGNGRARMRPRAQSQPWLDHAVGTGEWTGTPLASLLCETGLRDDAVEVVFTGADHGEERGIEQDYQRSLSIEDAARAEVLLAYELNGAPLPPQHGFPLRLLVPGWYGMTSVKWLTRITAVTQPFDGWQHTAYRTSVDADDPGAPVTRIKPRSLMVPPGHPDYFTRVRHAAVGRHRVTGRAWSGCGPVTLVEFSADGGGTWADAELREPVGPYAWRGWSVDWHAEEPGEYVLCSRATDAAGNVQPLEQPWNRQGMTNNMVQRVPVVVH